MEATIHESARILVDGLQYFPFELRVSLTQTIGSLEVLERRLHEMNVLPGEDQGARNNLY
ncbi:MAG: hypothetical protein WB586_04720 [Chthoniobacterales bacterium]